MFAAVRRQIDWRVFRDNARFFLIIGFLIAIATTMSYAAVIYIDPGTASLIARMGTIFALGFGILWLKERLVRGQKVGSILAVIGVFIISFQPGGESSRLWLGTLLVLASTFSYQLHAAIVKRQGGEIDFTNFFLFRMAATCLFLFFFALRRRFISLAILFSAHLITWEKYRLVVEKSFRWFKSGPVCSNRLASLNKKLANRWRPASSKRRMPSYKVMSWRCSVIVTVLLSCFNWACLLSVSQTNIWDTEHHQA